MNSILKFNKLKIYNNRYFSTIINEPTKKSIFEKLTNKFKPIHLEILNESYMHSVPKGSESHFKVIIVSNEFNGKSMISQHRLVNETIKDDFKPFGTIHALSIHSTTPDKWNINSNNDITPSPSCLGGSKKEKQQQQQQQQQQDQKK